MRISQSDIPYLKENHPFLKIEIDAKDNQSIKGMVHVNHAAKDFHVCEDFEISIKIPKNYPYEVPIVKEIGNKIPSSYAHKNKNDELCLAVNGEIMYKCNGKITLSYLFQVFIIPYLFSFIYYTRFGEYPFGEREHGSLGVLSYYGSLFCISDEINTFKLMKEIISRKYRGHLPCPCGSGKKIRNCHGQIWIKIINDNVIKKTMIKDYENIEDELKKYEQYCKKAK